MEEQNQAALDAIQKFLQVYRYLRRYSRNSHAHGVRGREFATLRYLLNGNLTIGQIRDYLFISVSSTSELISRLENAGYVARRRCKKDNRVVYVELTDEGRQLAEETPLGGIPLLRERIKTLPMKRLDVINQALSDIIDVMEIGEA